MPYKGLTAATPTRGQNLRIRAALLLTAFGIAIAAAGCASRAADTPRATLTTVTATEFAFAPAELTLQVGPHAAVRLQNRGQLLHDWTVDAIPATAVTATGAEHSSGAGHSIAPAGTVPLHVTADRGKSADVSFTPTQAGEYTFYCTVPGHREAGMRGRLLVRG